MIASMYMYVKDDMRRLNLNVCISQAPIRFDLVEPWRSEFDNRIWILSTKTYKMIVENTCS